MTDRLGTVTAAYTVRASSNPHVVCRLLGLFAQQDLVPSLVRVRRHVDDMFVTIEQPEIDEHRAEVIAEKMRAMVLVASVVLECRIGLAVQPATLLDTISRSDEPPPYRADAA